MVERGAWSRTCTQRYGTKSRVGERDHASALRSSSLKKGTLLSAFPASEFERPRRSQARMLE